MGRISLGAEGCLISGIHVPFKASGAIVSGMAAEAPLPEIKSDLTRVPSSGSQFTAHLGPAPKPSIRSRIWAPRTKPACGFSEQRWPLTPIMNRIEQAWSRRSPTDRVELPEMNSSSRIIEDIERSEEFTASTETTYFSKRSSAKETPIARRTLHAIPSRFVARHYLTKLVNAGPGKRQPLRQLLLQFADPRMLAQSAFEAYGETANDAYLLHARSLLEAWGTTAWEALLWIAENHRADCELYVGVIARFQGMSEAERSKVLRLLAKSPSASVRSVLLERHTELPAQHQRAIVEIMADDPDPEIRAEARERLNMDSE